jgi:hypothetical protein
MGYDINWKAQTSRPFPLDDVLYQKYSTINIGDITINEVKTLLGNMPLNPQTAPIVAYLSTILRIRALIA